jgi:hypothetical protein
MKQLILFVQIQSDLSLKPGHSKEGEPINIGYLARVNGILIMKGGTRSRRDLVNPSDRLEAESLEGRVRNGPAFFMHISTSNY